jgi:hypothetical protein
MKSLKQFILEARVRPSGWTRRNKKSRVVTNTYLSGDRYDSRGGSYQQDDVYNDSNYEGYILDKENNKYKVVGYSKQGDSGAIVGGSTNYRVIIFNDEGFKVVFTGWIGIMSAGSNTSIIGDIDAGYYLEDYLCKFHADSISDKEKYEELRSNGDKDAQSYVGRKNEIRKDKAAKFAERYVQVPDTIRVIIDGDLVLEGTHYMIPNGEVRESVYKILKPMFKELIEGTFKLSISQLKGFQGNVLLKRPERMSCVYVACDMKDKNIVNIQYFPSDDKKDKKVLSEAVEMKLASTIKFKTQETTEQVKDIIKKCFKLFQTELKGKKEKWIDDRARALWMDYVNTFTRQRYSRTAAKRDATNEFNTYRNSYDIDKAGAYVSLDIPTLAMVVKDINPEFKNVADKPDTSLNNAQDVTIVEEPTDLVKKEPTFKKSEVYTKMTAWHNGERKQNVTALSDAKLKVNAAVCKELGFDKELQILQDEAKSRGLKLEGLSNFLQSKFYLED